MSGRRLRTNAGADTATSGQRFTRAFRRPGRTPELAGATPRRRDSPPGEAEPLRPVPWCGRRRPIAGGDISRPLPPMRRPDIRQRVIEAVLDLAAEAGVDDVHLIAALAIHRRMTPDELRHAVGDRVYDAFAPDGRLYNHDAEDPDGMVVLGETPHG